MPRSHTALSVPLIGLAAALSIGCEEALSPPTPKTGAFRVLVATAGPEFGPEDGYRISLKDKSDQPVAINGAVLFSDLAPGPYLLQLHGAPTSCIVHGGNPRWGIVSAGATEKIEFHVSCRAMGSVRVTVVTTGVDPDPDGYTVTATRNDTGASRGDRIRSGEAVFIHALDAGDYTVALHDLALNCETREPVSHAITMVARVTIPVAFTVECAPVAQLVYVGYSGSELADIYIVNANGTGAVNLTNHPASDRDPAWSPDGRSIAFTSERDGSVEVWVMNADGSNPVQLTRSEAPVVNQSPAWSPDGRKIVFQSARNDDADIYVMNADGTGGTRLTSRPGRDLDPVWSPNGRIAFVSERDGNAEIYMMNVDGSSPVRLTNTPLDEAEPAWSPDGRKLAFARTRCTGPRPSDCERTVWVLNVGSREEPRRLASGHQPAWSVNGLFVAYTGQHCGVDGYYYEDDECGPSHIAFVQDDGTHRNDFIPSAGQAAWRP